MFQLTKRTEYGLIALTHLASARGEVTSAREITERYSLPERLLAQVMKELCRADLVSSHRGANGGYSMNRTAQSISIGDVVRILEDGPLIASCESPTLDHGLPTGPAGEEVTNSTTKSRGSQPQAEPTGTKTCEIEDTCPIRSPIHRLRSGLWDLLDQTTLDDLTRPSNLTHLAPLSNAPSDRSHL